MDTPICQPNIPHVLIVHEIVKRLPVKDIVRCLAVCASWHEAITSAQFIAMYAEGKVKSYLYIHHYRDGRETAHLADDMLAAEELLPFPPIPFGLQHYADHEISFAGSCEGLICLFGKHGSGIFQICLWNPSIRRSVSLPLPESISPGLRRWVFGFGMGSQFGEYKVISIVYRLQRRDSSHFPTPKIHLYQYPGGGGWRAIDARAIQDVILCYSSWVLLDRSVYHWLGCCRVDDRHEVVVVSFDMRTEQFDIIHLPQDALPDIDDADFSPVKTLVDASAMVPSRFQLLGMPYNGTSLSVCALNLAFDIWVCEGGTWHMQFRINVPHDMRFPGLLGPRCIWRGYNKVFGFRRNGHILIGGNSGLRSVDPATGDVTNLFQYRGLWLSRLLVLNYTDSLALIPRMKKLIKPMERNAIGEFHWFTVACGCLLMFGGAWWALIRQRR